jgi:eukaryotic-like serine/threonine-protein kinase
MQETDEERLADLLLQWEELRDSGRPTTARELCGEQPHLICLLERRIQALEAISWMDRPLEPAARTPATPPSARTGEPFSRELLAREPVTSKPRASGYLATQTSTPEPRTLCGRYRLDDLIAEGGFAQVWRAYDLELERVVAVKLPKSGQLPATEAFMTEARRVARLKHPGIVPVHDVGRADGTCFIVSEYMEGGSLGGLLLDGLPASERAVHWIVEIAEALAYAHQQNVIHRDIKPANILLDHHGRALLADFGIAQSAVPTGHLTPSLGTLPYMSPEQLEGGKVDTRSDIYSLGVVLHELLAHRIPYTSALPNVLRREIVQGAQLQQQQLPDQFRPILRKALARQPADRYASAAEMAADLRRAVRIEQLGAWTAARILLAACAVLVLAAWLWWPKPTTAPKLAAGWLTQVAALTAEEQVRAVADKLKELNPGFDGWVVPTIEDGAVVGLEFLTDQVTDISPVRALRDLRSLTCGGTFTSQSNGTLADLTPLAGLKLTQLSVIYNPRIHDLSPLIGMELTDFNCQRTSVSDLTPLRGMPLTVFCCGFTPVSDLTPLTGMPLVELYCYHTRVTDFAPLAGMPLEQIRCQDTPLASLEPLIGTPLQGLECHRTQVSDLSPLKGMAKLQILNILSTKVTDLTPLLEVPNLSLLWCDFVEERDAPILRQHKALGRINEAPVDRMWQ